MIMPFFFFFFFVVPQINLQRRMRVTGLITQGAKRIGSPEYVKSYKVAYSDDGKTWRTYKVKGKDEDMVRQAQVYTPTAIPTHSSFSHLLSNIQTKTHTSPALTHAQRRETVHSVKGRVEDMMRWLFN